MGSSLAAYTPKAEPRPKVAVSWKSFRVAAEGAFRLFRSGLVKIPNAFAFFSFSSAATFFLGFHMEVVFNKEDCPF